MPCEVCEGPATHTCAGTDVPMLDFCAEHAAEHERECPDVQRGAAMVHGHGKDPK